MSEPHLTPDMITAIQEAAERFNADPQNVLRRMLFSYAAQFKGERSMPDLENVVPIKVKP